MIFLTLHQFTFPKQFSIAQSEKQIRVEYFIEMNSMNFDREFLKLQDTYLYTSHRTSLLIASEKKTKNQNMQRSGEIHARSQLC